MSRFTKVTLAPAALMATLLAGTAMAQTAPDIVGDWHGIVAAPTGDSTIVLHVTRGEKGALTGEFENRTIAPGTGAPVADLAVEDGRLTFRVPAVRATYEGTWDEAAQRWRGAVTTGQAVPLDFSKGLPPPKPRIEGLDGRWDATFEANGAMLRQVLRFASGEWGTTALFDSPDQYVNNVPISELAREGRTVRFSVFRGAATFEGVLSEDGDTLSGAFKAPGQPDQALSFKRTEALADGAQPNRPQNPVAPFPYAVEEVAFDNPAAAGVRLSGTLTLPQGEGPFPVAIMISGSGQHDRDETLDGHKPFWVIADHLTRSGIAVLRFDDRGTGQSTGDRSTATSADKASDANAAFAYLLTRRDVRHDAIGFVGHSEGGLIGRIALASNDNAAFLVSLAGPATDIIELMLSQRRIMGGGEGASEEQLRRSEPLVLTMWQALAAAETPEAGRAALLALMTPETKAALGVPPDTDSALILRDLLPARVWYLARHDPARNLGPVGVPLLALNGSLDRQTEPGPNLAAWREATKDNPDATIVELPGINHMFQHATTGGRGEYRDIEETFAPMSLELISAWLRERFVER